jgi:1-aminocyclopropane-1-carboxylate deaminase/D-cysteine desulfhydrase-like pyridoxal-dependent ACC family enzyme
MSVPRLSPEEVRRVVAKLPRLDLAHLPTPLDDAPRFAERIGVRRVLIKRDDCTGLLFGGNKTRHLEFLLADALRQEADVIVWGAGIQSNNCRQTAAACARLGLECRLYLSRTTHDDDLQGNLLLDHLVGAQVELVDAPMGEPMRQLLKDRADQLRSTGRRVYVWDHDHGQPLAAVSYLLCLAEVQEQVRARGPEPACVYAAAAGPTGAGLVLGKAVLGLPWPVRLIAPIRWPWDTRQDMADVASRSAALLGLPHRLRRDDVDLREDFVGPAYGAVTPEGWEALRLLATTEGILLDPVYTSKAMAGLIHDVRQGRIGPADTVVFIHTGGLPALFAYRDDLVPHLARAGRP